MSSVIQPRIGRPSKRISPCVGIMPQSARSVVVLPAPFAPRSVVTPPSSMREVEPVQHAHVAIGGPQIAHLDERASFAPARDRPGSPPASSRTRAGGPSAILRPKFSATTVSEIDMTRLM